MAQACMPPAPPKASSAKSRGSCAALAPRRRESRAPCWRWRRGRRLRPAPATSRPTRRAEVGGDTAGALDVQRHAAAEEVARVEAAEQQVGVGDGELGAEAVAGRSRARRRRCAGRRAARRRCRRATIEPPPAPTVWMSITGSRTGKSPISRSDVVGIAPSIRQTSVDVPPMSKRDDPRKPGGVGDGARADRARRPGPRGRAHGLRPAPRRRRAGRRSTA